MYISYDFKVDVFALFSRIDFFPVISIDALFLMNIKSILLFFIGFSRLYNICLYDIVDIYFRSIKYLIVYYQILLVINNCFL